MNKNGFITFEGFYISISIETPHYLSEFVEYPVKVTYSANKSLPGTSFVVVKRYSDFDLLKRCLKSAVVHEKLPPKKIFGKFDMNLVSERQIQLEKYLNCLIESAFISKSAAVLNFLQRSPDHIVDYSKHAFQQVSLDFRCETAWQINKPRPEMGCRGKKCFITVNSLADQNKYILGWAEFGPEYVAVNSKNTQKYLKLLSSIKHEYIYSISYVMLSDNGASFIRPVSELGSLHDYLFKTKPLNSILEKYTGSPHGNLVNQISLFGRQILIGLKYLHDKGIPYGHLHIRNVLLVTEQKCALTDIENSVMGLIPQHRNFYVGILKKLTYEEIDIYSFGRLVYEMTFGRSLNSTFIENDDVLQWPSLTIREFLISVLTESVLKNGFPTIDILLESVLFKSYAKPTDKASFKIPPVTREWLGTVQQYSIRLLTADQKAVKAQTRKLEADAIGVKKKIQRQEEARRTKPAQSIPEMACADGDNFDTGTQLSSPASTSVSPNTPSPAFPAPPHSHAPPPPPPAAAPQQAPPASSSNTQLLGAICNFSKKTLLKTSTNDKSRPKV